MPFLPFSALLSSGMFFVRLDGSPNYAMVCNIIPALINIVLDYLFIFVFEWDMLRHKHYIHRLLSKHQTWPSSHVYYPFARLHPNITQLLAHASNSRSLGHLAGCTGIQISNFSLHPHNLLSRTQARFSMIITFAGINYDSYGNCSPTFLRKVSCSPWWRIAFADINGTHRI